MFFKSNEFCLRPIAYREPNIMDVNDNRNLDWSDNKNESSQPSRVYFRILMLFCKYEPVETLSVADGETMRTAILLFHLILCS